MRIWAKYKVRCVTDAQMFADVEMFANPQNWK